MKAIIETGSKQYTVAVGDKIRVEKLAVKAGETVEFPVLAVMDGKASKIGTPHVSGTSVMAKSLGDGKGKKVIVFKYKPKIGYRNKRGHRQPYTELEIISIGNVVKAKAAPAAEPAVSEAPKAEKPVEKKTAPAAKPATEKTATAKTTAAKSTAAKSTTAAKTTAAKSTTAAKTTTDAKKPAAAKSTATKAATTAKSSETAKKTTTAKSTATKTTTVKTTTAAEKKES